MKTVRIAVTDRMVLYGRNGPRKTKLLEAVALMAGDPIRRSDRAACSNTGWRRSRWVISPIGLGR